jgi:hypothetical protein
MERKQAEEIIDRVLTWPEEDQEKVQELEEWGAQNDVEAE